VARGQAVLPEASLAGLARVAGRGRRPDHSRTDGEPSSIDGPRRCSFADRDDAAELFVAEHERNVGPALTADGVEV
jgi:hypothetical protein